ncbi:MAG: hypothetical protein ACKOX5_08230, partial [Bacteroidota bacterium]
LAGVEQAYATFLEQAGGLRCLWVQWEEGSDLMLNPELYERFKQRLLGDFRYGMNFLNLSEL